MKMSFWVKWSVATVDLQVGFAQGARAWVFEWSGLVGGNVGGIAFTPTPFEVPGSLPALRGRFFSFELLGSSFAASNRVLSFRLFQQSGGRPLYEVADLGVYTYGSSAGGVNCEGTITNGGNVMLPVQRRGETYRMYNEERTRLARRLGLVELPERRWLYDANPYFQASDTWDDARRQNAPRVR